MKGRDIMDKKTYTADFKVKAVMESFQRDTSARGRLQEVWRITFPTLALAPGVPGKGSQSVRRQTQSQRESDEPGLQARGIPR